MNKKKVLFRIAFSLSLLFTLSINSCEEVPCWECVKWDPYQWVVVDTKDVCDEKKMEQMESEHWTCDIHR